MKKFYKLRKTAKKTMQNKLLIWKRQEKRRRG